ncbi:ZFPL1 [Bugula neritina]|uniref:ZFPL1 n=1 Tax=Bugula neritina TaxID=10212 RepID=A0A7J7KE20_BUGNE|nr:ZFPL1 [Bugula neritina]
MGLCKCPKRKVTNLFCFEHRVNVCEHCLVSNHSNCVVQSYLNWLKDSDYNPTCLLCSGRLDDENFGECVRLICYDLFHWSCLNKYALSLPVTTAPAGYQCPNCRGPIFPAPNAVSPVADKLKEFLTKVNWARAGLGLPLIDKQQLPADPPVSQSQAPPLSDTTTFGRQTPPTSGSSDTQLSKPVHPVQPTVQSSQFPANYSTQSGAGYSQPQVYSRSAEHQLGSSSSSHTINMADNDTDKYKRRPAFHFLSQWFRAQGIGGGKSGGKVISTKQKFFAVLGIGVIAFLTLIIVFSRLSQSAGDDQMEQELMDNLNIRVADHA